MIVYESMYYSEKDFIADVSKALDRYKETIISLSRTPGVIWIGEGEEGSNWSAEKIGMVSRRKPRIVAVKSKRRGARTESK